MGDGFREGEHDLARMTGVVTIHLCGDIGISQHRSVRGRTGEVSGKNGRGDELSAWLLVNEKITHNFDCSVS